MRPSSVPRDRYTTIDSLRGIAALAVTVYHLYAPAFRLASGSVTSTLAAVFKYGYLGVPIFFVISGFVIASSIDSKAVSFKYIGKFVVKRATRLDPPYWLSIIVDILLIYLTINIFNMSQHLPSAAQIVAHLFYLQNLLGLGDIAAIYWTLCLEVQFYIFYSLIFAIANSVKANSSYQAYSTKLTISIFTVSIALSILIANRSINNLIPGLFLSHWYLFMLGAACYWCGVAKRINSRYFYAYIALTFALAIAQGSQEIEFSLNTVSAIITALFIFLAAKKQGLSTWLNNKYLLFFGSISYSLYLFHAILGERFISLFQRWLLPKTGGNFDTEIVGLILFVAALGFCILASYCVFKWVETPSLSISKRIKPILRTSILADIRNPHPSSKVIPDTPSTAPEKS